MFPGFSDTHVPREATRFKPAPRGRSFSVGYLTWVDDLILLSITVIVDMVSTVNAPRCFRSGVSLMPTYARGQIVVEDMVGVFKWIGRGGNSARTSAARFRITWPRSWSGWGSID